MSCISYKNFQNKILHNFRSKDKSNRTGVAKPRLHAGCKLQPSVNRVSAKLAKERSRALHEWQGKSHWVRCCMAVG